MKSLIVVAFVLLALPVRAQDTTTAARDLAVLHERGVQAETRSKTTKRNPETGRSTIAMVEAYVKGMVVDVAGDLVRFLADDGDDAWIRTNAVALLEPADDLIALLESEGRDATALRELGAKWFPQTPEDSDRAAMLAWERDLVARGVPVVLSRFDFRVDEAGDVHPSVAVRNISGRTVAGVTIEVLGFNQHGDVVRDKSTGMATHFATLTGTIRSGDTALFNYTDSALWSNRSTSCIEVRRMVVTFEDGSSASLDYQLKIARLDETDFRTMGECSRVDPGP